jgi:hypothetical protein
MVRVRHVSLEKNSGICFFFNINLGVGLCM